MKGIEKLVNVTEKVPGTGMIGDIWVFRIGDHTNMDGAYFDLGPEQRTNVVEVMEKCKIKERVVKGTAWLIKMPSIGCHLEEVDCRLVVAGEPAIDCSTGISFWSAGKDGAVIENITEPPFRPGMEKVVEFGNEDDNLSFWELLGCLCDSFLDM